MQRYLLLWLLLFCGLAFWWPGIESRLPAVGDPFTATSSSILAALIAITMFAIGMMLPRDEVHEIRQRWPAVLFGTTVQFTAMPLLAVVIGRLLKFDDEYFAGIVMVGCVPGAMASNVVTMNARGHTSYSVSLTTASTMLSPLMVPLLLSWCLQTSERVTIPVGRTSLQLLLTVVLPVLAGYLVSQRMPRWESRINRLGTLVANATIIWIIATVVGSTREKLSVFDMKLLAALLLVNVLGYLAGYLGGVVVGLSEPMRRALTIEVGMQNAGLGAVLAKQLFGEQSAATIAPALYTFGCMLTGTLLARAWAMMTAAAGQPPAGVGVATNSATPVETEHG